jgi:PGF-CTERM protein
VSGEPRRDAGADTGENAQSGASGPGGGTDDDAPGFGTVAVVVALAVAAALGRRFGGD